MVLRHNHQPSTGRTTTLPPAATGLHLNLLPANWTAVFTSLFAEIDQHARLVARQEFEYLLAAQAEVVAEADRNEQNLTVQQAAEVLCLRPQTVYEWIKAGKLQALRTGMGNRSLRIKRGHVLAALQAQTQPDGRRKYARRINGAAKTNCIFASASGSRGKEVAYA